MSTAMFAAFQAVDATLQAAWAVSSEDQTRTKGSVAATSNALAEMRAQARNLVSIIQGTPGVTDEMKIDAGLTVRKTTPTPRPSPTVAPYVEIVGTVGRTVTLRLGQSKARRGKPASAASATIFTHVGEAKPSEPGQWQYAKVTTLTSVELPFAPSETGGTVWITAFWTGTRGESGPNAQPISVELPAAGVAPNTATAARPVMKLRAA